MWEKKEKSWRREHKREGRVAETGPKEDHEVQIERLTLRHPRHQFRLLRATRPNPLLGES